MEHPTVVLNVKDYGKITLELMPEQAPITVNNFLWLVKEGFYNGLTFHRVISGFMIQGGCPIGNGTGGPGWSITGEFKANGVDNTLRHKKGVISMARAQNPNSAGSQFFIMHQDAPHLDGMYAAFGKVTDGIEVVDAIAGVETDRYDKPLKDVVIESAEITDDDGFEITKP
jgi:peptidyl-prolyl cis-trans isomerase